ncbi:hypothetical protein IJ768_02815 [Candidatus Saccharibacteria bacterium]|nr:hypothetical protein [Candidatus Saccharibacteria bacterium]
MKILEKIKRALIFPLIGIIFATSALTYSTPVYADPVDEPETGTIVPGAPDETTETTETKTEESEEKKDEGDSEKTENATCYSQVGGLGWLVCPVMAFLAKGIDTIYGVIEDFLVVEPISMESDSPVYTIWVYVRNITNIVFVIFLLFIIYSQITGFGISNYGIKKALPRLIIAAILVNLSYLICVAAVDASNIIGKSLHDFLSGVAENALSSGTVTADVSVSFYDVFTTIAAGGVIGALAVGLAGGPLGLLLALIPVILGGIIAVLIGLVTISLRQAVIILLVAIAPLAFVAYLLPNTEKWFKKWTDMFSQMLFFYPMFSLLFGASKLASWIFISSANSMLGIILGLAVQVLPLILALSLMKMSGTILGGISSGLSKLGNKANSGIRGFTDPYKDLARSKQLAKGMRQPFNPLSVASWRAASEKRKANLKFRQDQYDKTNSGLISENTNALRRNSRIIGYDKNNQPIYTQLPVRRSNKYMNAEAEAREVDLRVQADNQATENAYGQLGDYQKEHGIRYGSAIKNASRMGGHYVALRTQMDAKARNDEADERFYNETVTKAAERYDRDDGVHRAGDLKNVEAYNRIVNGALGATGYNINQITEEGRRRADEARVNVIGDAYSRAESQRAANIKRFESYMDKQVTAEVLRQYEDMIKFDNTDGMVASHNVLAKRGDYDQIAKHMTDYMNSGKVKLGEDMANTLAMNFLSMKDAAPALARLGKFMNMETWQYTSGNRQTAEITMEQYITGRVEGDVDKHGNAYTTKIKMASGLEGTKLTGIDRTAYGVNDAIVAQFDISQSRFDHMTENERRAAIKYATDGRLEIETAMMPAEISALPTFASGSEQIRSMVGHLTGTKFNSKTGQWENVIRDGANGEVDRAIVDYTTSTYLKSLTVRDLINMKTDTWNGIVARYSYDYENSAEGQAALANVDEADRSQFILDKVHERLRGDLKTRIDKLAQGNMNVDMMKEKIYDALQISQKREEYWNARRKGTGRGHTDRDPRPHDNMDDPDNPFEPSDD